MKEKKEQDKFSKPANPDNATKLKPPGTPVGQAKKGDGKPERKLNERNPSQPIIKNIPIE